jgi:proteasome accessory factor A
VLDLWGRVLARVETGDLSAVEREIDWVSKLRVLEGYQRRTTCRCPTRASRRWTSPTTTCAAAEACTDAGRQGAVDRVATDLEIFEAKETPPQTTRARLRGEFIRHAQEKRRDFTVDWVHLKLNDQAQRTVLCKDPFRAYDERVDRLIASM